MTARKGLLFIFFLLSQGKDHLLWKIPLTKCKEYIFSRKDHRPVSFEDKRKFFPPRSNQQFLQAVIFHKQPIFGHIYIYFYQCHFEEWQYKILTVFFTNLKFQYGHTHSKSHWLYLSTIPTYNSHFNSRLNSHFLLSSSGNFSKKNSHF